VSATVFSATSCNTFDVAHRNVYYYSPFTGQTLYLTQWFGGNGDNLLVPLL